jgi:hypothetical protein
MGNDRGDIINFLKLWYSTLRVFTFGRIIANMINDQRISKEECYTLYDVVFKIIIESKFNNYLFLSCISNIVLTEKSILLID